MSFFSVPLAGVVVLSLGLLRLGWGRRSSPAAWPFLGLTIAILVWSVGYIWEIEASSFHAMVLAAKVQYLAIPMVPVGTLALTLTYVGRWGWRRPPIIASALAIPVLTSILAWTNEAHSLVWREITPVTGPDWSLLSVSYGSFFWIFVPYSYLLLFTALALVLDTAVRAEGLRRRQAIFIAVGMVVPLAGNVLHMTGLAPYKPLDLTAPLFAVSCIALGLPALYPGFLTLAPVARDIVLDIIDEGVVVIDGSGKIIDMNEAAAGVLQVKASSSYGRDADELLGPFSRVAASATGARTAVQVAGGDGVVRKYQCTRLPLAHGAGIYQGSALLFSDVTDLAVQRSKLEDINRDLEKFAYVAAHDIRSPLVVSGSLAHLLADELKDYHSEEVAEYLDRLKATTRGMMSLITGILEYSKIGIADAPMEEIDLGKLCSDIAAQYTLEEAVIISIGESMPVVIHNQTALAQIVGNLVGNAVKHSDKETCRVTIECDEKADHYEVSVADNGPGIPEEKKEQIFDLFESLGGRGVASSGIGLATVKKLVTATHGRLWVEPSEGPGARFVFTINK